MKQALIFFALLLFSSGCCNGQIKICKMPEFTPDIQAPEYTRGIWHKLLF